MNTAIILFVPASTVRRGGLVRETRRRAGAALNGQRSVTESPSLTGTYRLTRDIFDDAGGPSSASA